MITMDDLIRRVDELIKMGKKVLATRRERHNCSFVDSGLMAGFRSAALSFISSVYGNKPTYYNMTIRLTQYKFLVEQRYKQTINGQTTLPRGICD